MRLSRPAVALEIASFCAPTVRVKLTLDLVDCPARPIGLGSHKQYTVSRGGSERDGHPHSLAAPCWPCGVMLPPPLSPRPKGASTQWSAPNSARTRSRQGIMAHTSPFGVASLSTRRPASLDMPFFFVGTMALGLQRVLFPHRTAFSEGL